MALSVPNSGNATILRATSQFSAFPKPTSPLFSPTNQTHFQFSTTTTKTRRNSSSTNSIVAQFSFLPAFLNKGKNDKALKFKEELLQAISPLDRGAAATPEDQQRVDEIARKLEAVNPTREPLKSDLLDGKWELIYTTSQSILQTQRPKFLRSITNYQAINLDTLRAQNLESWPFFNQVGLKRLAARIHRIIYDMFARPLSTVKAAKLFDLDFYQERANYFNPDEKFETTIWHVRKNLGSGDDKFHIEYFLVSHFYRRTPDLTPLNARKVSVKFDTFKIAGLIPVKAPGRARGELEITYLDEDLRVSRGDKGNLFILKMVDPSYRVPV